MTDFITVKTIEPFSIGGAGYGNTYRFEVKCDGLTTISTCERDVASSFIYANLPVPNEFSGPYDCYGQKIK
jgi:hypothetical protein